MVQEHPGTLDSFLIGLTQWTNEITVYLEQLNSLQTQLELLQKLLEISNSTNVTNHQKPISSPQTIAPPTAPPIQIPPSISTSLPTTVSSSGLSPLPVTSSFTSGLDLHQNPSPKPQRNSRGEYPCNFCEKVFPCYSHMKKHEIVHSDQKPFKCDFCDKYFRRKYDCTRHMKGMYHS